MKKALAAFLLLLGAGALPAVQPYTQNYTGTGATVAVSTIVSVPTSVRWVSIWAGATQSAVARTGASNTSSAIGAPIVAPYGNAYYEALPNVAGQIGSLQLLDTTKIYVYVGSGDVIGVSVGN